MSGYDLLTKATRLLGMEAPDEGMKLAGATALSEVMTDLGFRPISSLSEMVGVASPKTVNALVFGLASHLALAMGDSTAHALLSKQYSRQRAALLGRSEQVCDKLFGGEGL